MSTTRSHRSVMVALITSALIAPGLLTPGPVSAAPRTAAAAAGGCAVTQAMELAGTRWVTEGTDLANASWANATFHVGNLAVVRTTGNSNHQTLPWAEANAYELPETGGPDDFAAGEAYLDLYDYFHPDAPGIAPLRARVHDLVVSGKPAPWRNADAINMEMPSLARIGVKDADPATLAVMRTLFDGVEKRLHDRSTGLWWSDGRYAHSVFYGAQANGWVLAGLAKVLQALPADDPGRAGYTRIMVRMAATLKRLQGREGFWNPDLLLPWPSGGPESTGTALLTYGIAWGINNGVLDAATYTPVVTKAWQGLTTKALRPDGFIGYVQDRDAAPWNRPAANQTGAQGVGAFLIAGREVAQLTPGCS